MNGDHDLLQLGARELAMHAVRDASGTLQGQVVEVHGGASKASRLCKFNRRSLGNLRKSLKRLDENISAQMRQEPGNVRAAALDCYSAAAAPCAGLD